MIMERTEKIMALVREELERSGIKKCVVATTSGETAKTALKNLGDLCQIIAVRKHFGANEMNVQAMGKEDEEYLKENNVGIVTATHVFGGINRAIRKAYGTWEIDEIISGVLRIFGVGVKVALEIAMMSVDAGYVDSGETIIAIGGEKKGASAAVVLRAVNTSDFFKMKVEKIIKTQDMA